MLAVLSKRNRVLYVRNRVLHHYMCAVTGGGCCVECVPYRARMEEEKLLERYRLGVFDPHHLM